MDTKLKINREGPLTPYRVLDLCDEKGFLCGKVLGDMGADVIKIEKPGGDPSRNLAPYYRGENSPERSLLWYSYNTSKKSVTLSIESSTGKDIFKKLVATADFIIESFQPGYLECLGLGYESLSNINPRIIMASLSPFGQKGPYRDFKATDIVAMAMGGIMFTCGDPDRAPIRTSIEQSYQFGGVQAAAGAMTAFNYRQETGVGQFVDISLQECLVQVAWGAPMQWYLNRVLLDRQGAKQRRIQVIVTNLWPCKGGSISWRMFTGFDADKTRALLKWMDEEGMAGDLKDVKWEELDMSEINQAQVAALEKQFGQFFLKYTKDELYRESIKRDIMLFPVYDFKDLRDDKQLQARDFWLHVEHPGSKDSMIYPGAPFVTTEGWWKIRHPAPSIGEHNEEILGQLGISKQEQTRLRKEKVI